MMRGVCSKFADLPIPRIIDEIVARIPPEIVEIVADCGGVFVGGFPLACMNGGEWGDVDVVFNGSKLYRDEDDAAERKLLSQMGVIDAKLVEPLGSLHQGAHFSSRKYSFAGSEINMIKTPLTLYEYLETFDFEFCKVAVGGGKLIVLNPEAVIRMHSSQSYTGHIGSLFYMMISTTRPSERVAKYRQRGYTINSQDLDWVAKIHAGALRKLRSSVVTRATFSQYLYDIRPVQAKCMHKFVRACECEYAISMLSDGIDLTMTPFSPNDGVCRWCLRAE